MDVGLSSENEISCHVIKSVLDQRQQQETSTQFTQLRDLNFKFGFLLGVENLINDRNDDNNFENNCIHLGEFYYADFSGTELYTEICDCKMLLRSRKEIEPKIPLELHTFIISYRNRRKENVKKPRWRLSLDLGKVRPKKSDESDKIKGGQ